MKQSSRDAVHSILERVRLLREANDARCGRHEWRLEGIRRKQKDVQESRIRDEMHIAAGETETILAEASGILRELAEEARAVRMFAERSVR